MKRVFAALLFLSVSCVPHPAVAATDSDVYRVSYECRDLRGNPRWHATAEIRHKEGDVYTIVEKLEGVYHGFDGRISWVAETEFERNKDFIRPLKMDQHIFDAGGKEIAARKQRFDYSERSVTCTSSDLVKNTSEEKKFYFTKDIINRLLQGIYVQRLLEEGRTSKAVQLISPEPALYDIELKVEGVEDIEINGRKRTAYKICFDPMLGLLNFVKAFLPKAYVWHSSKPIYELLKYEGIEASIDSTQVVITTTLDEGAEKFTAKDIDKE